MFLTDGFSTREASKPNDALTRILTVLEFDDRESRETLLMLMMVACVMKDFASSSLMVARIMRGMARRMRINMVVKRHNFPHRDHDFFRPSSFKVELSLSVGVVSSCDGCSSGDCSSVVCSFGDDEEEGVLCCSAQTLSAVDDGNSVACSSSVMPR